MTVEHRPIPCPFIYRTGERCTGHVTRVYGRKANITWEVDADGGWQASVFPDGHFALFCSNGGTHAGDAPVKPMSFEFEQLPEAVRDLIERTVFLTDVQAADHEHA